jgi:hypothetical protein
MKTCTVEGCEKPQRALGWCRMHYTRWNRNETLTTKPRPEPMQTCTIQDCTRPHRARGMCNMHYRRWQRHGDPTHYTPPNECGTYGAYQRHRAAGEQPCQPCLDAMNAYNRERRANMPKRPKPVARDVPAGTPHCGDCGRPMMGRSTTKANLPEGWARKHSVTSCTACYEKARKKRATPKAEVSPAPPVVDPALEAFNRRRAERLARQQRLAQVRRPAA